MFYSPDILISVIRPIILIVITAIDKKQSLLQVHQNRLKNQKWLTKGKRGIFTAFSIANFTTILSIVSRDGKIFKNKMDINVSLFN